MSVVILHDNNLPYFEQGGHRRVLAAKPSPQQTTLPIFEDVFPTIAEANWTVTNLRPFAAASRRDQQSSNACTGYSSTTACRYAWRLSQNEDVEFAPFFTYSLIDGGQDKGSSVHQALQAILQYGVCREQTVPELPKGTYQVAQLPQAAYTEAALYKFDAYRANTYEGFGTGLSMGFVGVVGIAVGQNIMAGKLDAEGVIPLPDRIIGGHALPIIGVSKGAKTGRTIFPFENSWGNSWADHGFAAIEKGHFNPSYGYPFDTFLIRISKVNPQDPNGVSPLEG